MFKRLKMFILETVWRRRVLEKIEEIRRNCWVLFPNMDNPNLVGGAGLGLGDRGRDDSTNGRRKDKSMKMMNVMIFSLTILRIPKRKPSKRKPR